MIICGGAGTRLTQKGISTPKCLLEVDGKTILERQVMVLEKSGIEKVLLLLGKGSQEIVTNFMKWGKEYSLQIDTIIESSPLGTAGALFNALELLEEKFLIIYGDLLLDADFNTTFTEFESANPSAAILYRSSDHMFDSDLLKINEMSIVTKFELKNSPRLEPKRNRANVGIYLMTKNLLESSIMQEVGCDFDREFLPMTLKNGATILALKFRGYVRDIGTLERLESSKIEFEEYQKNKRLQATVLLDRDGVINRHNGYVRSKFDFELLPQTVKALKLIFNKGYRIIVITNQPVVARGESTWDDVEDCHAIIDDELAKVGAYVTDYYVCIHHPDRGFSGERKELKFSCSCRKPEVGNFTQAMIDHPFMKTEAVFVGDSMVDLTAANNFGVNFIGIKSEELDGVTSLLEYHDNLFDFALKLPDRAGNS